MTVAFTDAGLPMEKESVRLVARSRDFAKGEIAFVHGIAAAGVDLQGRSGALKGPWGQAVPIDEHGIALRAHGTIVVAEADIDQDAAGSWTVMGPGMALVKFAADGTYAPQMAVLASTVANDCVAVALADPGTRRVKMRLASQVTVTDFATPQLVPVEVAGRTGF